MALRLAVGVGDGLGCGDLGNAGLDVSGGVGLACFEFGGGFAFSPVVADLPRHLHDAGWAAQLVVDHLGVDAVHGGDQIVESQGVFFERFRPGPCEVGGQLR